jgi:hypothetical protein
METTKAFIRATLEDVQRSLDAVLTGLNRKEVDWQPTDTLNSIGLILFHAVRSEDFFIQELVRKEPQVWEKDRWFERYGFPREERGRHYKPEQVKAFVSPVIELLKTYGRSVREHTMDYLSGLTAEEYSRVVKTPRGERPVSGFLSSIITHAAQHSGEISYLRGLQRGLNQ